MTASQLIKEQKNGAISATKEVTDIADNQKLLLKALAKRKAQNHSLLLDGHFTLLTKAADIQIIEKQVFADIAPNFILILHDAPESIAARLMQRDNVSVSISSIAHQQAREIDHARVIAAHLDIGIYEVNPGESALMEMKAALT